MTHLNETPLRRSSRRLRVKVLGAFVGLLALFILLINLAARLDPGIAAPALDLRLIGWLAAIFTFLSTLCFVVLGRLLTRPLAALTRAVTRISEGDLNHRAPVAADDELGHLAEAFNEMVERLGGAYDVLSHQQEQFHQEVAQHRRTEVARRDSEARYRDLFENAHDLVLSVAPDGRFLYANRAWHDTLGYADDMLTRLRLPQLVAPRVRDAFDRDFARVMHFGEEKRLETTIRTAEGAYRIIEGHLSPKHEDGAVASARGIFRDITAQRQFEEELVQARATAEEMARLKSAFLTNMSHEIRTPLTGIIGFAELLRDEVGEEHGDLIAVIERSGNRLLETLNSVLDLAQLEAKKMDLLPEAQPLAPLIREAVEALRARAEAAGLALHVDLPDAPLVAEVDARALQRIVSNLVGNALKFTPQGEVHVTLTREGHEAVLRVRDTGTGISQEFLPHLFDEFRQESVGLNRSHEGSGLGLAITHRLVTSLHGRLEVTSEKGVGSTFTVSFPATPQRAASPPQPPRPARPAAPPERATRRLLVVEDGADTRMLVKYFLKGDYQVDLAPSAPAALQRATSAAYDLVLLDINLGEDYTGVEVLQTLRELPGYAQVPMIAMTAYALPGDRQRFLEAGFDAYLPKPFTRDKMLRVVQQYLGTPAEAATTALEAS